MIQDEDKLYTKIVELDQIHDFVVDYFPLEVI